MGLHRFKPMPSGRMGIFWALSGIKEAAVVEFGCMGHNLYGGSALRRAGIYEGYGAGLYTTYVDETDISLGDTSRLADTIEYVLQTERPKAVFLQPSAVPEVIGTDLDAISRELRAQFPGVAIVPFARGSFAISQHKGVSEALLTLAEALPLEVARSPSPTYNIIGSSPDVFRFAADSREIARMMDSAFGIGPCCVLSSEASVSAIGQMGAAHVNLVIRQEGVPAAEALRKRFGTPYFVGRPYGIEGSAKWLAGAGGALGREPDQKYIESERELALAQIDMAYDYFEGNEWSFPDEAVVTIGGHYDVVKGIIDYATTELPLRRGVCWCDCPEMGDAEIPYYSESEWLPIVENHKKGYLMFSGEALRWAGKNTQLQVTNPDASWRIHPYEPPFVGFRGAVHLVNLWINEYTLTH